MVESTKAVFLSYASQDAEAARRICEALRAAGLEVWFDQRELRGGDARTALGAAAGAAWNAGQRMSFEAAVAEASAS